MIRFPLIATVLILAACTPGTDAPQPGDLLSGDAGATGSSVPRTEIIEVYSGGSFSGWTKLEIFPNDAAHIASEGPHGADRRVDRVSLPAGSYDRARALVEERLPRIPQVAPDRMDFSKCPTDVGQTYVYVDPPIAGRSRVDWQCDGSEVPDLQQAIRQAIGR